MGRNLLRLGVTLLAWAATVKASDWTANLTGPLSPGSVALLAEHSREPGVRERWSAALTDERPEVRAAAARVVNVSGSAALLPDLLKALAKEADATAAVEEIRAVAALGDRDTDEAVIATVHRLGSAAVDASAETLGRTRGVDALRHLAALRLGGLTPPGYEYLVRTATRGGGEALTRAATAALREADALAWRAVLEEARRARASLDPGVMVAAIGMESPRFRALTYWQLAVEANRGGTLPSPLKEAIASTPEATLKEPGDLDAQFAFEILQRVLGRGSRQLTSWLARAREGRTTLPFPLVYDDAMLKWLTPAERDAVQPPEARGVKLPPKWVPARPKAEVPSIRMTTRFPRRFGPDVVAVSGCAPQSHAVAGALMTYGEDGRPRTISVIDSGLSPACVQAGRALLLSVLAPWGDLTQSELVVVPLAPDVLTCGEEEEAAGAPGTISADAFRVGGRIKEPKKLFNVSPVYPESAKRAHVDGTVILDATISPSGCVQEIKIVQSIPMLNAAAMNAVVRWRYTPTLLNDRPVPIIMTVTVNFRLSP